MLQMLVTKFKLKKMVLRCWTSFLQKCYFLFIPEVYHYWLLNFSIILIGLGERRVASRRLMRRIRNSIIGQLSFPVSLHITLTHSNLKFGTEIWRFLDEFGKKVQITISNPAESAKF
jgi:hypothetical protein